MVLAESHGHAFISPLLGRNWRGAVWPHTPTGLSSVPRVRVSQGNVTGFDMDRSQWTSGLPSRSESCRVTPSELSRLHAGTENGRWISSLSSESSLAPWYGKQYRTLDSVCSALEGLQKGKNLGKTFQFDKDELGPKNWTTS